MNVACTLLFFRSQNETFFSCFKSAKKPQKKLCPKRETPWPLPISMIRVLCLKNMSRVYLKATLANHSWQLQRWDVRDLQLQGHRICSCSLVTESSQEKKTPTLIKPHREVSFPFLFSFFSGHEKKRTWTCFYFFLFSVI